MKDKVVKIDLSNLEMYNEGGRALRINDVSIK